jgi:chromosome segregation ATPase
MTNSVQIKKLEKQLETANARLTKAYQKPYYNLTDERRVHSQIEKWSDKVDDLEAKIEALK